MNASFLVGVAIGVWAGFVGAAVALRMMRGWT